MFAARARETVSKTRKRLSNIAHGYRDDPSPSTLKRAFSKKSKTNTRRISQDVELQDDTTTPRDLASMTGLRVSVTVRAESPVDKNFHNVYDATPGFEATEEVCGALVRRIQHCAEELITRPDARATEALRYTTPRTKLARYHMAFRIERHGRPWRELHYSSFQEQPLTDDTARDVVLEADRIVCIFLQMHDRGFVWRLPPIVCENPLGQRPATPDVGVPQNVQCMPSYADTPGYSITATLRVRDSGQDGSWVARLDSSQETPLTLNLGEALMAEVTQLLRRSVSERQDLFNKMHGNCDALEGRYSCQHFENAAFDLDVKVKNNYGPDYSHLVDRFQSFRRLVDHDQGAAFMQGLRKNLELIRDRSDSFLNEANELVLQVHELRDKDCRVRYPLTVIMGPSGIHSRKTMERVLERVVTGMTDVLRGHGTVAVVTAHKRGHFVLETNVCFGEDTDFYDLKLFSSVDRKMRTLQRRLRERVQKDMTMVLKDTLSLRDPDPTPDFDVLAPEDAEVEPLGRKPGERRKPNIPHVRKLSKKSSLNDLRRWSMQEQAASGAWDVNADIVRDNSHMADIITKSDSRDIPTPSLTGTATSSVNLQEGASTPQSMRDSSGDFSGIELGPDNGGMLEDDQDDSRSATGTVIHHTTPTSKNTHQERPLRSSPAVERSPKRVPSDEARKSLIEHLRQHSEVGFRESIERPVSIVSGDGDGKHGESSLLASREPHRAEVVEALPLTGTDQRSSTAAGDAAHKDSPMCSIHKEQVKVQAVPTAQKPGSMLSSNERTVDVHQPDGSDHQTFPFPASGGTQGFSPRHVSAEAAPAQTFVNASGLFHQRHASSPPGGHLGLHGEWQIGMGLRNALVPSHLRDARAEQDLHGWLKSVARKKSHSI